MKQKTFFTIAATLFILLIGFFAFQVHSLPALECNAFFTWECELYAQVYCLGTPIAVRAGSTCDEGVCIGTFKIYCDDGNGFEFKGYMDCEDGYCSGGGGW